MTASVDGWTRIGLACVGPTSTNDPDGLLKWNCAGSLHGIATVAAMDGDARGLFLASVSVPSSADTASTIAVFTDVAGATVAYASVADRIHGWLEAWDGGVDGITIGPASLAIAPAIGSPPTTTLYLTGPRKNVADPLP